MEKFETVEALRKDYDVLLKQRSDLSDKLEAKHLEIQAESVRILFQEKLLQKIQWGFAWDYAYYPTGQGLHRKTRVEEVCVLVAESPKCDVERRLQDLLQTDHHCQSELTQNAKVRFDDSDIRLVFPTFKELEGFCFEHGIRVNVASLHLDLAKRKKEISEKQGRIAELEEFLLFTKSLHREPG